MAVVVAGMGSLEPYVVPPPLAGDGVGGLAAAGAAPGMSEAQAGAGPGAPDGDGGPAAAVALPRPDAGPPLD